MPIRSPEWEINEICARFITNIAPCESLGSTGDPHFRYWPEAAENDVRSNVGYRRDKRTPCTQNEFCRSGPDPDMPAHPRAALLG